MRKLNVAIDCEAKLNFLLFNFFILTPEKQQNEKTALNLSRKYIFNSYTRKDTQRDEDDDDDYQLRGN
jgi:hypothetical protein